MSLAAPSQEPEPERTRTRRRRLAIVGIVTVVIAAAHVWYGNRHHFFDLLVYRDAMRWWDAGNPLYAFIQPDDTQGRLGFTYPPFAAYLLRPLAWMTPAQTVWAYSVIAVAAFAASIWWLVRPLAPASGASATKQDRGPAWFVFALAFVASTTLEPIREAFTFGQINVVLWALILLDLLVLLPRGSRFTGVGIGLATAIKLVPGIFILYLLVTRRWIAAGVATATTALATGIGIGLATAIKLVPGIFILYLLVTRRWRAAAVAVGTALGATALAAAAAPGDSWTFFTSRLPRGEGVGRLEYAFNQSILGTLARLAYPGQPSRVLWIGLAVVIIWYGMWRAAKLAKAGDEVAAIAVVGIVGSLASPVTWVHHLFWFVPALVVLVDAARRSTVALAAVVYLTVTVSVVALWEFSLGAPGGPVGFALSNWYVWLMLALLVLLPARAARDAVAKDGGEREPAELARRRVASDGDQVAEPT